MTHPRERQSMPRTDPDHPIITVPWTYTVVDLHYHRSLEDPDDSWVHLVLQKGDEIRRLRFTGPRDISIDKGFPDCPGLYIADVSNRQLEGLTVHVDDYEGGPGGIEFWAADVIDLDDTE